MWYANDLLLCLGDFLASASYPYKRTLLAAFIRLAVNGIRFASNSILAAETYCLLVDILLTITQVELVPSPAHHGFGRDHSSTLAMRLM